MATDGSGGGNVGGGGLCLMCRKVVQSQLRRHFKIKHCAVQIYHCPLCPRMFKNIYSSHRHMSTEHPEHKSATRSPFAFKKLLETKYTP